MNPATPLEVRDVSVLYGANRVLDHVAPERAGNEFVVLLDASGCGKTTLLRTICRFVPLAGDIECSTQNSSKKGIGAPSPTVGIPHPPITAPDAVDAGIAHAA